jgi:hypothetical protein
MQTEQAIDSNSGVTILPAETSSNLNLYPVDAAKFAAETVIRNGGEQFLLTHFFRPADLAAFDRREKALVREFEQLSRGRERTKISDDAANEAFHDEFCVGGEVVRLNSDDAPRELSADEMRELETEQKRDAVRRLLECQVKVVAEGGGYGFLFSRDGALVATLTLGDEAAPSYTVTLRLRRPDKHRRSQFRDNFTHLDTLRGGDKPRRAVVTDLRAGANFFREHFLSAEGVMVGGEPYRDEHKAEFLQKFCPYFQAEVAAEVVGFFDTQQTS